MPRIPASLKAVGAVIVGSAGICAGILAFGKSSGAAETTLAEHGKRLDAVELVAPRVSSIEGDIKALKSVVDDVKAEQHEQRSDLKELLRRTPAK